MPQRRGFMRRKQSRAANKSPPCGHSIATALVEHPGRRAGQWLPATYAGSRPGTLLPEVFPGSPSACADDPAGQRPQKPGRAFPSQRAVADVPTLADCALPPVPLAWARS